MLSALLILPLMASIGLFVTPSSWSPQRHRAIALTVAIALFAGSVLLGIQFDPQDLGMQFSESFAWIDRLGIQYQLGVDGLSLPLVILNNFLTAIAIYSSDPDIKRPRFYYAMILLLNIGVTGAFMAQDLILFFVFYELEIIPLYFLIAIWGGNRRGYAATKFLIYTAFSGVFILAAFLGTVWLSHATGFSYDLLRDSSNALPLGIQITLLTGLLVGFGIKIPFFPFHTWLPDAHVEASTPVSVLLAGVLLKLGTYGLLRFGLGLFLDAWLYLAPWLAIWAAVSALYGASCAIAQKDMKKVVAYSSIAHMAFILLAYAATTRLSIIAANAQMISHGLISAMLFLLVGVVYKKTGSRDVTYLRGLLAPERGLPLIGSLMILGVMASSGTPGMVGFIAEFLVFRGSFPIFPVATLLCMVGTGLTAVYFLLMVNRVFFGRLPVYLESLPPVNWGDRIPSIILSLLIIVFGLQPVWLTRWTDAQVGVLLIGQAPSIEALASEPLARPHPAIAQSPPPLSPSVP
jgi:NAD(P)H-quinone oxidoreductase subunit 4